MRARTDDECASNYAIRRAEMREGLKTLPYQNASERILQRELNQARVAQSGRDSREIAAGYCFHVVVRSDRERRVIGQIEKVGPEPETLALPERKGLADGEVHIPLVRADEAVARRVAVASGAVRANHRGGHERIGI